MVETEPRRVSSGEGKTRIRSRVEAGLKGFPNFHDGQNGTGFLVGSRELELVWMSG